MEFIKANFLNTTTMISLSPNTQTGIASNLFNRDPYYQFYTDGMNSDSTTQSITITFDSATNVSRIGLLDINLKEFSIFYNGVTANAFGLSGPTTTSSWVNNSVTSMYLKVNTIACTSITIDMKKTMAADSEKIIGLVIFSDNYYETSRTPSSSNYKPKFMSKQVVHKLSDGGTRIHQVKNKWQVDISLDYILPSEKNSLYTIWGLLVPFNFIPFPTSTGWDGICFESVWEGDFDFYEYSDNASVSGFSGKIKLRETPV